MLGAKLTVVLLDNRGYGCINRLQRATGGEQLQQPVCSTPATRRCREIDFAAHAASLGAPARKVPAPRRAGSAR